jgi:hypothetical protein
MLRGSRAQPDDNYYWWNQMEGELHLLMVHVSASYPLRLPPPPPFFDLTVACAIFQAPAAHLTVHTER